MSDDVMDVEVIEENVSKTPEATETVEAVETAEVAEAAETAEVAKPVEATEAVEATDSVEEPEEAVKATEAEENAAKAKEPKADGKKDKKKTEKKVKATLNRPLKGQHYIDSLEKKNSKENAPYFNVGDTVKVNARITEGNRSRIQVFEGIVLKIQGGGNRVTFTVRKSTAGIGVERTWPLHSPSIENVEVIRRGKVRRAKLFYLRKLSGKKAKVKELIK